MKINSFICAVFLSVQAVIGATYETDGKIYGDYSKEHGGVIVKNSAGGNSVAEIEFDLTESPLRETPEFAAIYFSANILNENRINASLTLSFNGKDIAGGTLHTANTDGFFPITKEIAAAIASGKKNGRFQIRQNGSPDAQNTLIIKNCSLFVSDDKYFKVSDYMRPIGKSGKITDEPIFFIGGENGEPAKGNLLFAPKKVISARSFGTGQTFKEGEDFKVSKNIIELLPNSRIIFRPYDSFYNDNENEIKKHGGVFRFDHLGKFAFFSEGDWFHNHDTFFTYEYEDGAGNGEISEKSDLSKLPKTVAKLKRGDSVKIVLFGDSITQNSNASGRSKRPPYVAGWGELAADALREKYKKAEIRVFNRALSGMRLDWGVNSAEELVAADAPDLCVIAFGMNDSCDAQTRTQWLNAIIEKVKAKKPDAEFVIITPMMANPFWYQSPAQDSYEESDKLMEREGVAVANVRGAHKELLKIKEFSDLTGNNVNHPNDFLIRIYAQALASKLMRLK